MKTRVLKVSIVIPSYNGKHLLKQHLPFVLKAVKRFDPESKKSEILVVDDASTDGTREWLAREYREVGLTLNEQNLRFGQSCNRGVRQAKGDVVVLLNNDVRPQEDFLLPLLVNFYDQEVFAVGCREVNFEAGKKIYGGRGVSAFRRGLVVHWRPRDQKNRRAAWVSAGSAAYRRDRWLELGGFDPLFRPAYEEDRDLCWQALKAGWGIVFEARSVVEHHHEATNLPVFGRRKISIYSFKNQLLFVWKNISSPRLLLGHLLWLPYHLIVTALKTKGVFGLAFFAALLQLPEAIRSRRRAARLWVKSDEETFKNR